MSRRFFLYSSFFLVLLLCGASFSWGYFTQSREIFPHSLILRLAGKMPPAVMVPANAVDPEDLAALSALGYYEGTYDQNADLQGVLIHDPAAASPGLNLYYSWKKPGAQLLTMEGEVVHRWSADDTIWGHVEPLQDGGVLVTSKFEYLRRLSRDSEILWTLPGGFHHALWLEGDRVWAIDRVDRIEADIHDDVPVFSEEIVAVSMDGEELERHSILDMLRGTPHAHLIPSLRHREFRDAQVIDPLHANHVEVFDGSQAHHSPLFAKGNLLIGLRHLNLAMIVDGRTFKAIWVWGPVTLTRPHHPSSVEGGRILVFNNGLQESEILELEPETHQVVWSYAPGESFFTEFMGSVQRLPNGNTLITESGKGYVFEIDREGKTVWQFANPDVDEEGVRAAIWRMSRYAPGELPFESVPGDDGS